MSSIYETMAKDIKKNNPYEISTFLEFELKCKYLPSFLKEKGNFSLWNNEIFTSNLIFNRPIYKFLHVYSKQTN